MSKLKTQAKRDFGSFHSSNVEELIRLDDDSYQEPDLKVKFEFNLSNLQYGSDEIREKLFNLDKKFTFLNHGAFGVTFKPVLEYIHQWHLYSESQPLRFYDREILPLLVDLLRRFSKILKCKPTEIVFVENCTFAFNSIVNSFKLKPDEKIFIFNTNYGVYKKILREFCVKNSSVLVEETLEFSILSKSDIECKILNKIKSHLENDKEKHLIKYMIFDYIPSNTPFILPVKEIIEIIQSTRNDIVTIIDGAHALGSITDLNLTELNADIFITNCHKWLCGPKGTAILYKNEKRNVFNIKPIVYSHGINSGFHSEFLWCGLKDYSAFLGLYATLDLWNLLTGFNNTINYCTELVHKAALHLKVVWNTEFLVDPTLCSTMLCVKLPIEFIIKCLNETKNEFTYDDAEIVQDYFYYKHNIEVPVKSIQNCLYVRISCHIYNNINDFKHLAKVVKSYLF